MATSETLETPMHRHNCRECFFLGRADGRALHSEVEVVDLYFCPPDHQYVMRTGSYRYEYTFGSLWGVPCEPRDEVFNRVLDRGLLEEDAVINAPGYAWPLHAPLPPGVTHATMREWLT